MIQTNDLTYRYLDSKPLVFPNIKVEAGNALLIHGESGCGKTTFLHLLAGLRQSTTGQIRIGDDNISNFSQVKIDEYRGKHIGVIYQQPYFIQSLSVLDNLLISPYAEDKSKANTVAGRLQISELLFRLPQQLSVGQQQRASIARAVMNKPKILLADEPTSALDNKNCKKVIDLLLEEAMANDAALVVATHDDRLRTEISDCVELNGRNN